jgi:hypothetical protein
MTTIQSVEELTYLRESVFLECKLAAGRDGKGALPEDFWPTYSGKDLAHGLQLHEHYEPQEFTVLEMRWTPEPPPNHAAESSGESSGETGARILLLLAQSPTLTAPELAQRLGLSTRAVEKQLAKLKAQNRLRRVGPHKGGHWEVLP